MSGVIEWARRVGRAQLRHERVQFDRVSLTDVPEYREAVGRLSDEISRAMHANARRRLAARLQAQPLLQAMLAPHGSALLIQYLVVFTAAGGATIFLTRSGVDFRIGASISGVLCLVSALLMAVVVLREMNRGPMPRLTIIVTGLVAAATVPGLGLAAATRTLADPEYIVWWIMLGVSLVIALVLLALLGWKRWAIGTAGRARIAADLEDWSAEVRAAHADAVRDAASRLEELWAAVPAERRISVERARADAADVLADRGLVDHAEALRAAVPGALELDRIIAVTGGWGAGSTALTTARIVPVVDDREPTAR